MRGRISSLVSLSDDAGKVRNDQLHFAPHLGTRLTLIAQLLCNSTYTYTEVHRYIYNAICRLDCLLEDIGLTFGRYFAQTGFNMRQTLLVCLHGWRQESACNNLNMQGLYQASSMQTVPGLSVNYED